MSEEKKFAEIPEKFLKPYDPKDTEKRIYEMWEKSGFFNPDNLPGERTEPFTIMMPPPNVTGVLHMGHALGTTIQDILIRYHRMRGKKTLWLPGTDHAAIATQSKVEGIIKKEEGLSRHDLGREELLKRVRQFAQDSHDTIISQIKTLGASCDWSREAFTLDEKRNLAVNTVFKKMYDDGLIYRGYRIVNWDPKGQTTISDDEIVYEERDARLYTFKYSKDFPISISTTRPETKVGDVAVAVHPEDSRYEKYIGKTYVVDDFCGVKLEIKIIADENVDPEFGTGALGVTPAHSMTDWEMAEKNNLPIIPVINEYAKMSVGDERISSKKTTEVREIIVQWLRDQGLLEKEETVKQNVGTAERTGGIVEPLPKLQWFVAVNKEIPGRDGLTLKDLMRKPVESGEIRILPDYFGKTYFHWIDNLKDWCISRQIWYGHRIPVWYDFIDDENGEGVFVIDTNKNRIILDNTTIDSLRKDTTKDYLAVIINNEGQQYLVSCSFNQAKILINSGKITLKELKENIKFSDTSRCKKNRILINQEPKESEIQDQDTLDTWFSSALWTFSTLGWPEKTEDLKFFHPTNVLETGYEILFFWIARMILMSEYVLEEIPFKTVYLHGTVRDNKGRKMSKSLGNGLDPVEIAAKFGADAARMALIVGTAPGTDMRIDENKIKGYKNFANKLWNIARFILENIDTNTKEFNIERYKDSSPSEIIALERVHQLHFEDLIKNISQDIEGFRLHIASEKIYQYIWHELADKIIEESKEIFTAGSEQQKIYRKDLLLYILNNSLKLLHPFMPFVTEEIWQLIHNENPEKLLIIEKWPI